MFSFFKKTSAIERMNKRYQQLMHKAMEASKTDRRRADELYAEAELLARQMESSI
jgi:truncated hemoglobin YjbI